MFVGPRLEEARGVRPEAAADVQAARRVPGALYGSFYGLRERPFELTADPRFLFLMPRQREALANLRYGLTTPRGLTLLLGEAGTGKTTLLRSVLSDMQDVNSRQLLLSHPTLSRSEFFEFLARGLGLSDAAVASKALLVAELQRKLEQRLSAGGLTNLIIDEAQSLPRDLLEEVRLLSNIETATAKLLNIVLVGQPELADRLNEPDFRQLKQRISLRCNLTALSSEETAAYVAGRLRIAGGSPADVFTRDSVDAIHEAASGIPRTINVVCDNVLLGGFAAGLKPIPVRVVEEVCRDFDLPFRGARSGRPQAGPVAASPEASPQRAEAGDSAPVNGTRDLFGTIGRKRRFFFF